MRHSRRGWSIPVTWIATGDCMNPTNRHMGSLWWQSHLRRSRHLLYIIATGDDDSRKSRWTQPITAGDHWWWQWCCCDDEVICGVVATCCCFICDVVATSSLLTLYRWTALWAGVSLWTIPWWLLVDLFFYWNQWHLFASSKVSQSDTSERYLFSPHYLFWAKREYR